MADAAYTFIGHEPAYGYFSYRDLDSGETLVAEHGQSYRIASTEPDRYPVPPGDGRWAPAASADGKAAKARAKVQADIHAEKEPPPEPPDPPKGDTGVPATANPEGSEQ